MFDEPSINLGTEKPQCIKKEENILALLELQYKLHI